MAPFVEVAAASGLDFVHWNGMSGELYFPEMMGGGVALLDADGDGDLDVYLVQGSMLPPSREPAAALVRPPGPLPLADRLYRNDLGPGPDRVLRFVDISAAAGLPPAVYGMGVATGDYDNDGRTDLYVTGFGANRLLHNDGAAGGNPVFSDRTEAAGVEDRRWSVAATFFDYDRDGFLDLYVGNYLEFTIGTHKDCRSASGARDYCGPTAYRGVSDRLWRNRGDGTFEDRTAQAGLGVRGRSLGAVAADLDRDGFADLYVANDGEPNFLWHNEGDGTFRDTALEAGCAVNAEGRSEASMGVAAADYDGDGDVDLFVTHLALETHTLYENRGDGTFRDVTARRGLGRPTYEPTGFGTGFLDVDNDGVLDLFATNGAVHAIESQVAAGAVLPLAEVPQLFRGMRRDGDVRFEELPVVADRDRLAAVGRGAAFGDLDNDGDTDVVVANNGGAARLLRNDLAETADWVGLRLVTRPSQGRRDALGARVALGPDGGPTLWREAQAGGSYAAAHDVRVLAGLGSPAKGEGLVARVFWPDGTAERWSDLPAGTYTTLEQGTGLAIAAGDEGAPRSSRVE